MPKQMKRYLVHIRFGGSIPLRQRIPEAGPVLKAHIEGLSFGKSQLAWTSDDGGSLGFLMLCDLPAGAIRAQLESPGNNSWQGPGRLPNEGSALIGGDSVMVLEIGEDFSANGFGRAGTWLQHNHPL